ncbi:DUF3709 domain-containing protein [Vibrio cholerae]|nr:DUF3709 domain-containing protein [Vibrio cholerae]EJV7638416.1 DUF3709 domain-containing protein [Vibrio cholerae]EKF9150919.1 DUF3709 domain-containing protein [Vibrio cholerae]ELF3152015.1 DUF3709 domain-containing protein [Vibrio cholerae]ELH5115697.1 DUF3709 domain-containing protein [Vibrio cholerae]
MLCLSLVVMRCQPLRRALCLIHKNQQVVIVNFFGISFMFCRQFNIVFRCLMKQQCVYRFKFQRDCLIELLCSCVVSRFVGEGFHIGLVAK